MITVKDCPKPTARNQKSRRDSSLLYLTISSICGGIFLAEIDPGPWWMIANFLKVSACATTFLGAIWFISQAARGFHFGWPNDHEVTPY